MEFLPLALSPMWLFVTAAIFLVFYAALISFYYRHWKNLPAFSSPPTTPELFLSVVIAARNEEKTLPLLLQALARQTYPQRLYEVIVVDDFSTDGTAAAVKNFDSLNVKLVQPEGDAQHSSKKKAIEGGVGEARGELWVITDGD